MRDAMRRLGGDVAALTNDLAAEERATKTLTRRLYEECDAVDRMREEVNLGL